MCSQFSYRVNPRNLSRVLPQDISSRNNEFLIFYFNINYYISFKFKFYAEFKYVVIFSIRPPSKALDPLRLGKTLL